MKRIIYAAALLLSITFFATSCTKVTIETTPASLTGSWILTDAAKKDAYGWYNVTTGVEDGVFYFYNNGTAKYVEGNYTLSGSWNLQTSVEGYYDEYGTWYVNAHQSMSIHVANYSGSDVVDMYFDNVKIGNNSFVGTNYDKNTIGRYRFSRY